jgi:phage shock protein PspC (stress-responsive transcriptional regulator)
MNHDTAQFLVTQKLQTFNNICSLCMAWWTSSVVFSAAIVSGVWLKKKQIADLPYFGLLGAVIAVFFISLVVFGGFIFAYTFYIDRELSTLVAAAGGVRDMFHLEVVLLRLCIADAVSSFLLIIAAWIVLWRMLSHSRGRPNAQQKKA